MTVPKRPKHVIRLVAALLLCLLAGCAAIAGRAGEGFADQLGDAVYNSNDPATVRDGLPAYLLLVDALVQGQTPGKKANAPLLFAAAGLNGAYAGSFTGDDAVRARRLSAKALDYARRGTCLRNPGLCEAMPGPVDAFEAQVADAPARDIADLYALGAAWAGYLQAHSDDWSAIADLPKVQALLERVAKLDPGHDRGMARVYLGVLHSLRPESVGGRPELGRQHFEAAIAQSGDRNLYAKVLMAETYARLVYDQPLHDRLLDEVLAADPAEPGFTLMNVLAQERAKALVASGREFF
ncbi:TRAP transporter TatT component family protein [Arenimonas sp.]|uniref:TRAP transporter TatT component family protein n=1 Tax=Arenimonas sp. TaxID=1872635 RepID=UPI0035B1A38B